MEKVKGMKRQSLLSMLGALAVVTVTVLSACVEAVAKEEPAAVLGVVYADGRQTEDVALFKVERGSDELYFTAYDIARIFKSTKYWNPGSRKLVLRIDVHRYMFTVDTRVVVVDEDPILMRVPVRYREGSLMIPLEFISEILTPRTVENVELDEERLVLTIGSPDYNVTDLTFAEGDEGSKAVLLLTEELLYHVDSETPGLLRLKIYGGRLNPLKFNIPEGKGLFNRVRAEQTDHDSYLFFDVKRTAARFRVEFETDSFEPGREKRLVIFLSEGELPDIPEVDFAGKRMLEILDDTSPKRETVPIRTIAIDPGHGGVDNGRVGPGGVLEKDVNLELSLLLRDRLVAELGVDVVITRVEDELVAFNQRVSVANAAKADLFISIHCNGWYHPDAGGFETYFLAPARTEEEAQLARVENASLRFENPDLPPEAVDDLDFILWDMIQNKFINESSEFAELIQKELSKFLEIRNRGVKQSVLRVLKGLQMPAALVEVAFLSNPREEKLLIDTDFQENVVRGIVEAVRRFQNRYSAARVK